MYQLEFDDLYDDTYDMRYGYDLTQRVYATDALITLIEELYNSKTINSETIAKALNTLILELQLREPMVHKLDVYLEHVWPKSDTMNSEKKIELYKCAQNALEALIYQMIGIKPFDDASIAGSLIHLAKNYGVAYDDAKNFPINARRKTYGPTNSNN